MPRDRRRRRRAAARRGRTAPVLLVLLGAVVLALAVGSLIEIPAQSAGYRTSIDIGYGRLAERVVDASNQTGAELATLMNGAAQLPNRPVPFTARNEIQQGLDQAVASTSEEATQAAALAPPYPAGNVSTQFTEVMSERSRATSDLRTAIDRLLGMVPLPIAGAPSTSSPAEVQSSAPPLSIPEASAAMTSAGLLFLDADTRYRNLIAYLRHERIPIHLPASVWVPAPVADAPLGSLRLGGSASALAASPALVPFHQLVITSAGLVPPAVPPPVPTVESSGGPGIVGDSCSAPLSTVPGSAPVVLPPTTTVGADITLTNCGTVAEWGVKVTETLQPVVPVGQSAPPIGHRGGSAHTRVDLTPGSSAALSLPSLPVAGGHFYELSVSVALPPGANPSGSSQQFFIEISM